MFNNVPFLSMTTPQNKPSRTWVGVPRGNNGACMLTPQLSSILLWGILEICGKVLDLTMMGEGPSGL